MRLRTIRTALLVVSGLLCYLLLQIFTLKPVEDTSRFLGRGDDPPSQPTTPFKILHIMSYHSPWEWTDTQFEGFKEALKPLPVEYRVLQMDLKQNRAPAWIAQVTEEAKDLIATWEPDLVYASDDDAQKYVTTAYLNTDLPFVFSAVNAAPEDFGFHEAQNVTGVLETEHFVESLRLLLEIVPSVKKIAVVLDEDEMWRPVVERMRAQLAQFPELEFPIWDTIGTYEEYKRKILSYQETVDAIGLIGIFSFKDENGVDVKYQEVLEWTVEHSMLPDFSFWKDRVTYGTLCVVSVSGYEQGIAAGRLAKSILSEGRSPSSLPIKATEKGEPWVSLARARKLGIKLSSSVLLTSKVATEFAWESSK
ncbi:MAG: hypothetical protein GX050_10130 [Firmicutes bacterium]|nr:hypothetical protein [Bacillota bacterium]